MQETFTDPSETVSEEADEEAYDYSKVVEEDLIALKSEFPELASMKDIYELKNPIR